MLGLDSSMGKDIVGIINNVFQAPWGGSHTCQKDEKALECSLCQSSILCYQLGCELLERLTPRDEIHLVVSTEYEDIKVAHVPKAGGGVKGMPCPQLICWKGAKQYICLTYL